MCRTMADRAEPPEPRGLQPDLGIALGRRSEECAAICVERLDRYGWTGHAPSAAYLRSRYEHLWFATLLVARWLVIGENASAGELGWISHSGRSAAVEGLSLVNIARVYLVWRDVLTEVLTEESVRVSASPEALALAITVVRTTCDGGLMRMTHTFDSHLHEVAAALEEERRNLREATLHDQLTGLANRVLLYDRLGHAMAQSDRDGSALAVLLIDLDGFKDTNDTLGHRSGDLALVELGRRLSRSVRQADTVARLGGDEFVVVLPHADRCRAVTIAEKLWRTVAQPLVLDGTAHRLGASIGVAVYPDNGEGVDTLLLAADHAMYAAKRKGGGVNACPAAGAGMRAQRAHGLG
jgi:diguanylate cyclase (GGDEF)-like protein